MELALAIGGLVAGILAGILGIGGGTILVPLQVSLGIPPVQAAATSNLSIVMTSIAGSIQNWRMGMLDLKRVILLGIPALLTAQVGAIIASRLPSYLLLAAFGVLLLANTYLVELRKKVATQALETEFPPAAVRDSGAKSSGQMSPWLARALTGGAAGLLAGLFGIGGGVILVPMQILLLKETIKVAIQTSLGAIVITAVAATASHAGLSDWIWNGLGFGDGTIHQNVLWIPGLILGTGGLIGVQISTRTLPKLPDETVSLLFRGFLAILSLYIFWQAWQGYRAL
jgi:hypothetical protein